MTSGTFGFNVRLLTLNQWVQGSQKNGNRSLWDAVTVKTFWQVFLRSTIYTFKIGFLAACVSFGRAIGVLCGAALITSGSVSASFAI